MVAKRLLKSEEIQNKIINNGIKNMKEFGYPSVNIENIFTDLVYAQMFQSMLKENLGQGFDDEINVLLSRIKINDEES